MGVISTSEELLSLTDNTFIGTPPEMHNSSIEFRGTGNILYCEEGVRMRSTRLLFNGNNAVIALGKDRHPYVVNVTANNNCSVLFGRNIYFNKVCTIITSEERSVVFGDGCLVSLGVWIRTADPHLIYSAETHDRINPSKDVIIGDHVWIGQDALILKGTYVGSGSILGGMAVVSGKHIESNSSWVGNPAKMVSNGLFWEGSCVHTWTAETTEERQHYPSDEFLFTPDESTLPMQEFCDHLHSLPTSQEKLDYWLSVSYDNTAHNRFAIAGSEEPKVTGKSSGLFKRKR